MSPTRPSEPQPPTGPRTLARALLATAMVGSAAALMFESRGQTIRGDELGYAARLASEPFGHAVFHSPSNKYFIAVPLLVYDAMFNLFGLAADVPYRIVVTALVLLCGGLFYLLARRRVGDVLAIPPTVLLLFFGSGWETLITAIRIPALIAVACGLGSLLVLERRDRRGDIAATVLLGAAVASHPLGLSFLAAAAVLVIARPSSERWKSLWVIAVPAAVFGAWWLFWRSPTTGSIVPTRPIDVVRFAVDSWISITTHVSGLAGVIDQPTFQQTIARILAAALFAALIAAIVVWWRRVPATLWAALVALAVLTASTRLSPGGFLRMPEEVRYLYPQGVVFLLLGVEVAAVARLRAWALYTVGIVLALGLVYNLGQLRDGGAIARAKSHEALGAYSAYEIAGPLLDESYKPGDFETSAGEYVEAANEYGSVADSPGALLAAPDDERRSADAALAGSLGIKLQPGGVTHPASAPTPKIVRSVSGRARPHHGCVRLEPVAPTAGAPPAPLVPIDANPSDRLKLSRRLRGLPPTPSLRVPPLAEVTSPALGLRVLAPDISRTALLVGRFWEPPSAQLDRPRRGRAGIVRLPASGVALPWRVTVASDRPVTVCGLGAKGAG